DVPADRTGPLEGRHLHHRARRPRDSASPDARWIRPPVRPLRPAARVAPPFPASAAAIRTGGMVQHRYQHEKPADSGAHFPGTDVSARLASPERLDRALADDNSRTAKR